MMAGQGIKVEGASESATNRRIGTCPKNLVTAAGDLGQYYAAATDADLQMTLGQVMADAVCDVTLNPRRRQRTNLQVSAQRSARVSIRQDGLDATTTWGMLRLHGAACSTYAAQGSQSLFITNGCETGRGRVRL